MATSGVRHDSSARLCVLLCETLTLPDGIPPGGEGGLVCHWYSSVPGTSSNGHRSSDPFMPKAAGQVNQLDWCVFLVTDNDVNTDLRLTVATLDGNHLGVFFGNLRDLATSDQFDVQELTLQNVNGTFASVVIHAAAQIRWTRSDAPPRTPNACDFVDAVDDAQALHIWQFLFQDRPPPPRHGAVEQQVVGASDSGGGHARRIHSELNTIEEEPSEIGEASDLGSPPRGEDTAAAEREEENRLAAVEAAAAAAARQADEDRRLRAAEEERQREAEREAKVLAAEREAENIRRVEAEEAAKRLAEEDARRRLAEEDAKRRAAEEEAERCRVAEEEARRLLAEQEAKHRVAEEEAQRRRAAEAVTERKLSEAEDRRSPTPQKRRRSTKQRRTLDANDIRRQLHEMATSSLGHPASSHRRSSRPRASLRTPGVSGSAPPAAERRRSPSARRRSSAVVDMQVAAGLGAQHRGASAERPRRGIQQDPNAHSAELWRARSAVHGEGNGSVFRLGAELAPSLAAHHDHSGHHRPAAPWDDDSGFHSRGGIAERGLDSDHELLFSPRSSESGTPPAGSSSARVAALRKMMRIVSGGHRQGASQHQHPQHEHHKSPQPGSTRETRYSSASLRWSGPIRSASVESELNRHKARASSTPQRLGHMSRAPTPVQRPSVHEGGDRFLESRPSMIAATGPSAGSSREGTPRGGTRTPSREPKPLSLVAAATAAAAATSASSPRGTVTAVSSTEQLPEGMLLLNRVPTASEHVFINGVRLPMLTEQDLGAFPSTALRDHALLLHRTLGSERLGPLSAVPYSGSSLTEWVVAAQRLHLEPILRPVSGTTATAPAAGSSPVLLALPVEGGGVAVTPARAALAEAALGAVASAEAAAAASAPSQHPLLAGRRRFYRVTTTGLAVRMSPDVNAARSGTVLRRGEIFEASVVVPGVDGRVYLKLAGARGWVFDDSAIDPIDPSVERVAEEELPPPQRGTRPGTPSRTTLWAPHAAVEPAGGPRAEAPCPALSVCPPIGCFGIAEAPVLQMLDTPGRQLAGGFQSNGTSRPVATPAAAQLPTYRHLAAARATPPGKCAIGGAPSLLHTPRRGAADGPLELSGEFRDAMEGHAYRLARRHPTPASGV